MKELTSTSYFSGQTPVEPSPFDDRIIAAAAAEGASYILRTRHSCGHMHKGGSEFEAISFMAVNAESTSKLIAEIHRLESANWFLRRSVTGIYSCRESRQLEIGEYRQVDVPRPRGMQVGR